MSNIKINDVFQRIQYAATNGQTQFTIPFPFFDNAYVTVWQDGVVINQGAGIGQYGITGAGSPSGGLVTLVTPATLNSIITIEGIMPIDRTSIYSATISNLTGSDLNGDFNREVVMMKQIQTTQALLQLQYAPWEEVSQDEAVTTDRYIPLLPPLGAWRMNAGGTAIETFLTPSSGGLAPDDGTYLVQTADADLPDAIPLDTFASGFMVNQIGTGFAAIRSIVNVANQTAVTNGDGVSGNPTIGIASNPTIPGTEYILFPSGTTAQRPGSPINGMVRFNTDLSVLEVYESSLWDPIIGGLVDSILGTANQITINSADPIIPVVSLASNPVIPGTAGITLPTGTTAQRGGILGTIRFNSQTSEFEGTTDGAAWNTFQTSAGTVLSVSGTANQIDSTGGANPILSLSATANFPGTFNIQSTTAINAIINDSTLATATTTNIATASALKTYIDNLVTGLNIQGACVCASTVALTATYANGTSGVGATLTNAGAFAAISLDGVSPTVGQRVLIKNQASLFENGIYTVTTVGDGVSINWVLTRATDYDTPTEIQKGDLVVLTGGTTQNQSSWLETDTVATIGTDAITFIQFTASLPVTVPSGGTGNTTFTAYSLICAGTTATGAFQNVSGLGTANQVLVSNGAGALPSWQSVPGITPAALTRVDDTNVTLTLGGTPSTALLQATSLTLGWTGQLSVPRGGTGLASATAYAVLCGGTTSTGALQSIASVGTAGQVLTSNGPGALPTMQAATAAGGLRSFQIFTTGTAATYTRPAGITSIFVEVYGAGAGGGYVNAGGSGAFAATGGGGGGYAALYISSAAATYTYTVGTGGAGGIGASSTNAGNGGTTSFGASLQATGGSRGFGGTTSTGNVVSTGGTGGAGTNGTVNGVGGQGLGGSIYTGSLVYIGCSGGSSHLGDGGYVTTGAGNGNNGVTPGSGGAGAWSPTSTNYNGGSGADGLIVVWEFA